jgi:hypothetical protein
MHICQIQQLFNSPEKDWNMGAVRNIVIWKEFKFQLRLGFICDRRRGRIANRDTDSDANLVICDEEKEMIRGQYQEALRQWLMPVSLRKGSGMKLIKPMDLGIKRLCCKQAIYERKNYAADENTLELAPHSYSSGKTYCTCLQGEYY